MPPYFFISGKKKTKFFKDLNKKYKTNLMKQDKRTDIKNKKVVFNLANNKIKSNFFHHTNNF